MTTRFPRNALLLALLLAGSSLSFAQTDDAKAARFYEDALSRYEKKDIPGTIIQLKNALQLSKTQLPVHMLLGKALLANSDPAGAEIAFTEAQRLGVNRAEIAVPLAQALVGQGKHAKLLESSQFETAGLPVATQQELLLIKATAQTDLGQLVKAQQLINDARALNPAAPESWLAEAPLRLRARQFPEALSVVDRALALAPNSAEAHYQRGTVLHMQGQLQAAVAAYDKALAIDPDHVDAALARIGIAIDQRRDQDAQRDLATLLKRHPSEPRAVYLRSVLAERAGDSKTVKSSLTEITALIDPVSIEFIRYRPQLLLLNGMAHFSLGELDKAKPYLEAAARVQGPSPIAKILARVYLRDQTPDKAVEVLESYLRVAPDDSGALILLASIQISQGRHARAGNLMREALKAHNDPGLRTVLGMSQLRGGNDADGQESLEQAFKSDPKQIYAGTALVAIYLRDGKTAKAASVAETMVRQAPGNASLLVLQGTALARGGNAKPARQAFEAALKLEPQLPSAQMGLAQLDSAARDYTAASNRLLAALKLNERNVDVLIELAKLAEAQGKADDALRWLTKADDVAGLTDTRPNLALIHLRLKQGLVGEAMLAGKRLITKTPEDPVALTLYARVLLLNADTNGARSSLNAASRRAGTDVNQLLDIGELQLTARDMPGASYTLGKLMDAKTTAPRAQGLMAGLELMQGDTGKAEQRANQLVQSYPKLALGHHLLADIALSRRKPAAAMEPLRRAYQLEPTSLSLLRLFSVQQSVEGLAPAVQTAEAWLKQHPRDARVIRAIGDAYARGRNFDAARKAYERALQVNANDAEALNSLASVLVIQGDKKALALAQRAVQLDDGNALYIDTLGWAEFKLGNAERALPLLRDARLRRPGNAEIRLHLGEALARSGRNGEARTELNVAAASVEDPASAKLAQNLLSTLK